MSLTDKIVKHQKKIAVVLSIITVLAIEENYIGFGKEMCSSLYEHYENFCYRIFNPENLYPEDTNQYQR